MTKEKAFRSWLRPVLVLACLPTVLLVCPALDVLGQERDLDSPSATAEGRLHGHILSAYDATPLPVVNKMLELADVQPDEAVYDLGSGDGRIPIMAAQRFGAHGVGIELDPLRCAQAIKEVQAAGLMHQVRIIEGDVLEEDLSGADVITIYLPPYGLRMLKPHLEESLRDGTRIVVVQHKIPGWEPAETVTVTGGGETKYKLTLYESSQSGGWTYYSKFGQQN